MEEWVLQSYRLGTRRSEMTATSSSGLVYRYLAGRQRSPPSFNTLPYRPVFCSGRSRLRHYKLRILVFLHRPSQSCAVWTLLLPRPAGISNIHVQAIRASNLSIVAFAACELASSEPLEPTRHASGRVKLTHRCLVNPVRCCA